LKLKISLFYSHLFGHEVGKVPDHLADNAVAAAVAERVHGVLDQVNLVLLRKHERGQLKREREKMRRKN
jgi:hypothetical protein